MKAFVHVNPACRRAGLTLAGKAHSGHRAFDRPFQVRVVHYDHRRLAAQFERHRDQLFGSRARDDLPGLHGTGKGDLSDVWMSNQWAATFGTETGKDIEDARWQDLVHYFADA